MAWMALVGAGIGAWSNSRNAKKNNQPQGGTPGWQQDNQRYLYSQAQGLPPELAEFTQDQLDAMGGVRDMQGKYDPYYDEVMGNASRFAEGVGADDINAFYNPYEDQVIQSYLADLGEMRNRADTRAAGEAEAAGAFGGDREAVYRAVTQGEYDRTGASTIAGLRHQGWDSASNLAMRNHAQSIVGNRQLGDLIGERVGYDYGDLDALMATGSLQQQQNQRRLDLPRDHINWLSDINNAGSHSAGVRTGPYQDPWAAGAAGFQSGWGMGKKAYDYGKGRGWWGGGGTGHLVDQG